MPSREISDNIKMRWTLGPAHFSLADPRCAGELTAFHSLRRTRVALRQVPWRYVVTVRWRAQGLLTNLAHSPTCSFEGGVTTWLPE
jgi:hypothetical protein